MPPKPRVLKHRIDHLREDNEVFSNTPVNKETLPMLKSIGERLSYFAYKFQWEYKMWGSDYPDVRTVQSFRKEEEIREFENNLKNSGLKLR